MIKNLFTEIKKKILSKSINKYTIIIVVVGLVSILQLHLMTTGLKASLLPDNKGIPQQQFQTNGSNPTRIIIDKVNINLPIVSQPIKNGSWDVESGVANYAEGTSNVNPGGGNVGIFAHDQDSGFRSIKNLHMNDKILLYGPNYQAIYEVFSSSIITPQDVNVFSASQSPELTLITCNGIFSEKRYMVKAKLVDFIPTNEIN